MATDREQIEHPKWMHDEEKPWRRLFKSNKWLKKQMTKLIRRKSKNIEADEHGYKTKRKPTKGWEH